MNKKDTYITFGMLIITATLSLMFLPDSTKHSSAEEKPIVKQLYKQPTPVAVKAKAAFVFDTITHKTLFAKNELEALPLASLTKIMTAVTAADLATQNTVVTIGDSSLAQNGDSGLYLNEKWNLKKLLQYTLVASSNDGAAAVASALGVRGSDNATTSSRAFVTAMNAKAKKLELNTMRFYNPSGLDESQTEAGAYGSAQDVAALLAYAMQHDRDIIEPTRYASFNVRSIDELKHTAQNTDKIANTIPSLIAGKTGYTDLAGGNLAVVFDAEIGHPVVVVVLGSTYNGRFEDVKSLVDFSLQSITNTP